MAIRFGASALGLVSAMPSGPGIISEELIAEIASQVPPAVDTFLLTCKQDAASVIAQQKRTGVNTFQLTDRFPIDEYKKLRESLPEISIVQVIHVMGDESLREAVSVSSHVDAVLLDSGNPTLPVKQLGGTGRKHNWDISKRIREEVHVPVYLAGGLTPENVRQAVELVQPFGVDVCSGVRTNGRLDEEKLYAFFQNAQL